MVDLHCHILPQVDDGASSLEEALDMARMAAASGVTDIVATSHFPGCRESLSISPLMQARWEQLSAAIAKADIPIRLHLGAEILCMPETMMLAEEKLLPTLGDTRYVLTEFHFGMRFSEMDEILRGIADAGYTPVIAHPERYDTVQHNPMEVERWFRRGYVLQMNKGSVLGAFGSRVRRTADFLLDAGLVHIIATDAHSAQWRTPDMRLLVDWMEDHLDPAYAHILLEENPRRLIRDRKMVPCG